MKIWVRIFGGSSWIGEIDISMVLMDLWKIEPSCWPAHALFREPKTGPRFITDKLLSVVYGVWCASASGWGRDKCCRSCWPSTITTQRLWSPTTHLTSSVGGNLSTLRDTSCHWTYVAWPSLDRSGAHQSSLDLADGLYWLVAWRIWTSVLPCQILGIQTRLILERRHLLERIPDATSNWLENRAPAFQRGGCLSQSGQFLCHFWRSIHKRHTYPCWWKTKGTWSESDHQICRAVTHPLMLE